MKKRVIRLLVSCVCVVALAGCSAQKMTEETTQSGSLQMTQAPVSTESTPTTAIVEVAVTQAVEQTTEATTEIAVTETLSETAEAITPAPSPTAQSESQTEAVSTTKAIEKTGEMEFSDDVQNRYISAVSQKYGVDAKKLVALYTVPENDSNIVLEFDGTTNADGSSVRNKDTLIAIYSIDKALNSKRASEDKNLNEYSYAEMKVMFFTTTNHIMPEFEELK